MESAELRPEARLGFGREMASASGRKHEIVNSIEGDSFYEGIDVTELDSEERDAFWEDLARRHEAGISNYASHTNAEGAEELTFEEARARLLDKFHHCRQLNQEIMRRTLALCVTPHLLGDVEKAIQEFPEFPFCTQTPYRFIAILEDGGGLLRVDLDANGEVVAPEQTAGLSEDEIDDLVEFYRLETTDVGKNVADEMSPVRRLRKLFSRFPDRRDIYRELLSFIKSEPCNYEAVEKLFRGRDFSSLHTIGAEKRVALQPSVFLDNMEKAGGIVWDKNGWRITREGEEILEELLG